MEKPPDAIRRLFWEHGNRAVDDEAVDDHNREILEAFKIGLRNPLTTNAGKGD